VREEPREPREPRDMNADDAREDVREPRAKSNVKLANPQKILFPRDGITKAEIFAYYRAIAPVMLRHLEGRPINLERWPNGIDEESWFQHNLPPKLPEFVRLVPVEGKRRLVAENVETLEWLANLAALTIHQWASHLPHLDQPDYFVLDLDPGDATTWAHVIEIAHAVHALLDALKLPSAVKTSGKRGLHVFVPFTRGPSHERATAFAEQVARAVAKVLPQIATIERMKEKRGGKLYVDYLQNGEGRTVVAPYSIRAIDGACVSTPLGWDEVTTDLDPRALTIRTVPERVRERGDLFDGVLDGRVSLPSV
jgi:bifunctional non-homologous end joining protein LigD